MGRAGRGGGGGPRMGGGRAGGSRGGGRRIGAGGRRPGRSGRGRNTGRHGGFGRPRGGRGRYYRRPRPFPMFGWGGGYGRYRRGGCGGCGCLPIFMVLAFIMIISNFTGVFVPNSGNNTGTQNIEISDSSQDREPIESGQVNETPYYTDELNWIQNEDVLIDGMRHFYNETNIQPHLYLTDNLNGDTNPTMDEIDQATAGLYDELFTDEAHMLLVFFENEEYQHLVSYHTAYGSQAQLVMDNEAEDILFDYLDYYYTSDVTDEEYFGLVFQETADRIMEVTSSPWIPVFLIIGLAILVWLLYSWWKNSIKRNKKGSQEKPKYSNGRRVVGDESNDDDLNDF